jgi:hypothetical protein
LRLVKPHEQIYLFLGDSPSDLGAPFVRMQEFYESPSKLFRRRVFTLAQFKAWYCRTQSDTGKFTYYRDFFGYNLPSSVFNHFLELYADQLTSEEMAMLKMMGDTPNDFYVIGAPAEDAATIDHELSHAFFYLFDRYRNAVTSRLGDYDLSGVNKYLKANMYSPDMYADEAVSYVMFDDALLHRSGVSTKHLRPLKSDLLKIYSEYKRRFIK